MRRSRERVRMDPHSAITPSAHDLVNGYPISEQVLPETVMEQAGMGMGMQTCGMPIVKAHVDRSTDPVGVGFVADVPAFGYVT